MMFKADDVLAAAILSIIMLRRIEILRLQEADYPAVPGAEFNRWRELTLSAYRLGAVACVLKLVANQAWFFAFSQKPAFLVVGGASIFISWLVSVVIAWRRSTEARILRGALGIGSRPR
jgi:hypothetical protein